MKSANYRSREDDGILTTLIKTAARAWTAEIKHQAMTIVIDSLNYEIISNNEGYFELTRNHEKEQVKDLKFKLIIHAKEEVVEHGNFNSYQNNPPLGIISDIDDTILLTGVNSRFKLRLLYNSLFVNPFRRKAIKNAALYYGKLKDNSLRDGPFIYISNNPWNIYDYLADFLNYNCFPKGEIILRDYGFHILRSRNNISTENKYLEIKKQLQIFQKTHFLLIGDSAENDFDIYHKIYTENPERIKKVIIFKANNLKNESRIQEVIRGADLRNFMIIDQYQKLYE